MRTSQPVWCKAKDDFGGLESNFTVAAYLPSKFQDKPPKPKNPRLIILKDPKDESIVYVRSFGGFAIESTVLKEAKALSEALHQDNVPHEKTEFVYAAYDTPERLTGRHNEVIMWPPEKKEAISNVRVLSASRDTGEELNNHFDTFTPIENTMFTSGDVLDVGQDNGTGQARPSSIHDPPSVMPQSTSQAIPSSIHDPPSVEDITTEGLAYQNDIDHLQQQIASQLEGQDTQTVSEAKAAVQQMVQQYQGTASMPQLIQAAQEAVQEVLHAQASRDRLVAAADQQAAYQSYVPAAISGMGAAVANAASSIVGGGDVNDMVREEEGSMAAEDVVHPLRALAQQAYSQDMTSHAANQAGHAEQQRQVAGGPDNWDTSKQNSQAGSYNTVGPTGDPEAHQYAERDIERARQVWDGQTERGMLLKETSLHKNTTSAHSSSYEDHVHKDSGHHTLEGDAAFSGMEAARARARAPF
eukprot:jgi/Astpho2/4634/Aster-00206